MSDEKRNGSTDNGGRPSEVLTALPRSRPHRRSDKRAAVKTESGAPATPAEASAEPTKPPEATAPTATGPKTTAPRAQTRRAPATKPRAAKRSAAKPGTAKPAAAKPAAAQAKTASHGRRGATLRQPPQPRGLPPQPEPRERASHGRTDILATAVQAAAELTEIGLSAGARALRQAVSRLPRP